MSKDKKAGELFSAFVETIAALRHPEHGCPWDLEQDHKTLRRYMLEEAYEAVEAMTGSDPKELAGELGDVLLQVVLNAQIADDNGTFDIHDVIASINDKMIRRHPHVFDNTDGSVDRTVPAIKRAWQEIKAEEKAKDDTSSKGWFEDFKTKHPATTQALDIGKAAAKINFDWDDPKEVLGQVLSEVEELKNALAGNSIDEDHVREEIGDVYFSLAQLCRHHGFDPETTAWDANRKFISRFELLESIAKSENIRVDQADRPTLERLWQEAKKTQAKEPDRP